MPKRRPPAPRAPKVPARFRALGGVDPRKLPPGAPYPCGDALVGQRARGKRLAGVVQSCAVPPAGSRGPHYALGNVVSGSEIGRAWRSSAREAEALDARYRGPDFDLRRKRAPKARTAAPSPAPAAPRQERVVQVFFAKRTVRCVFRGDEHWHAAEKAQADAGASLKATLGLEWRRHVRTSVSKTVGAGAPEESVLVISSMYSAISGEVVRKPIGMALKAIVSGCLQRGWCDRVIGDDGRDIIAEVSRLFRVPEMALPLPEGGLPRPAVTRREELPLPLPQGGLRRREVSPEGLEIVRGFDELSRRWGMLPSSASTPKWLAGLMVIDGDLHVYGDALVVMGVAGALGNLYPPGTIRDVFKSAFNDAARAANLAQMAQTDRAPVVVDVKPVPAMRAQPVTRSVRLSFTSHGESGEHFDVRAAQGARLTRASELAAPLPKGGLRRAELPLPLPEGGLPRPKTRASEGYSPSAVQEVVRSFFATGPIAPDAITVLDRAINDLMLPPRLESEGRISWVPRDPSAEVSPGVYNARSNALTKRRAVRDGAATRTTRAAKTREQKNAAAALMDLIEGATHRLRTLALILPVGMFPSDSDSGEKAAPTKRAAPSRVVPAAPVKRREELPLPLPKGGLRRAELPLPLPQGGLPMPRPMPRRSTVVRREELAAPLPPGGLGKKSLPLPEEVDAPACPPKITVRWIAPRWVATGNTYNAKDTLSAWGFRWSKGLGAWSTDDPAVAMKARKCMDPASRVEVERRVKVATPIPEAPKGPPYTMTYEDEYWVVRGNTRDIYQSLKDAGWRAFKRGEQWDGWRTDRPEIANSLRNVASDDALVALDAALRERDNILALSRAANEEDLARIKPGFTCADIPVPPGLSYRPYQCVGIVYAANRPGVLIGDEPGLGKTIQAIGVVNVDPTIERVLVICPASLRNVWRDHFERWTVRPTSIYVARNAKAPIPEHANVVIFGFQAAVTRKGEETPAAYADAMKQQWDLLIVDEGHFLKNPEAKRTQAILGVEKYDKVKKEVTQVKEGLAHRARRKVFLTGTPLPNRPLEMWPLLHALAPKEFKSWGQYAYRYTNVEETKYGIQFKGSRNEAELNERMRTHVMIRRLKIDVLKDLPPKQRVIVPFDPEIGRAVMRRLAEGEYAKMLEREARRGISSEDEVLMDPEELLERWMSELKEAAAEMRGQNLDLAGASVAMGPKAKIAFDIMAAMRRDLAVAKIPSLLDYVSGILEEKPKVVIMAHHREVQDALVSALVKHLGSAEAVVLHRGGMADKDKSEAERRFQTDPKVRVFVGSIMASGVGITLTAADQLVMAEIDWVPANNAQAEDRIHRIGQTLPATIHYPLVDGSIEAKLIRTCVEKLNIADRILDDDVRTKMLRDPITSPALRPPQNTLETWAFETMVSVVKNPPPRIGWRDMSFAREVASSPYLTDRRWRAAIATAIRLTGGSASRFDAKFGVSTRPPATQLEAWAGRAMTLLADLDSDRAEVRNGEGFSKSDGGEGHALAAMARLGQMSDADWQDAIRLAKRYKRQVGEFRATPDGEQRENPGRGRRRPATPTRRRLRR